MTEVETTYSQYIPLITEWGLNILAALLILLGGWILSGWLSRFIERRAERTGKLDRTISIVLGKIVRTTVLILTLLAVLERFGVKTTSIVALLGAAGLAIGLALQGALSNVAAGVMLLVFRPFKVGDVIDFGNTGTVDEIGLFLTKMRTGDNVTMFVPNSKIWGNVILNFAYSETRRVDMTFSIGYNDNMDKAIRIIQDAIKADPRFLQDPAPLVAVAELGESSVNIWARPWVKRSDYGDAKLAFIKKIKEEFDANGISIPFPQRDVHLFTADAPAKKVA